eukprot:4251302-Pyramimonas_sp.AAC.1
MGVAPVRLLGPAALPARWSGRPTSCVDGALPASLYCFCHYSRSSADLFFCTSLALPDRSNPPRSP